MSEDRKRNVIGSAATGAGATAAGVGLVAGGIPGAKSDFTSVFRMKPGEGKGVRRAASTVKGAAPAAKAVPGGILGFRVHAHEGGTRGFEDEAKKARRNRAKTATDAFYQGRNEGKIAPEKQVLRGMKQGRRAANAALVGGLGLAYAGNKYRKGTKKPGSVAKANDRRTDSYNAALAGAGTTGAVTAHAVPKFLDSKKKKYEQSAAENVDRAGRIAPGISGRQGKKMTLNQMHKFKTKNPGKPWPKSMYPSISDGAIKDHPEMLRGVNNKDARLAGHLRGAATQERHFAEVMGNTAKAVRRFRTPSAVAAGVGVGGLMASSDKKVRKSMSTSAFGVDHGAEIYKAENKPKKPASAGRVLTGAFFPGIHGAVAGKKGKKFKAGGTQYLSGVGGSVAGGAVGALASRGRPTAITSGSHAGGLVGGAAGTQYIHNKGYLKKE